MHAHTHTRTHAHTHTLAGLAIISEEMEEEEQEQDQEHRWQQPAESEQGEAASSALASAHAEQFADSLAASVAQVSDEPSWQHGVLTRQEAAARLLEKPESAAAGLFFVYRWEREPTVRILALLFKGKATHHKLTVQDGKLLINNRSYVESGGSLPAVLRALATTDVPQWPQRLTAFVPRPGATQDQIKEDNSAIFLE